MKHDIQNLTLREGVIFHIQGAASNRYLDLKPVKIVKSDRWTETPSGVVEYRFTLAGITDPQWRELFKTASDDSMVSFEGSEMKLMCPPKELASRFARIKEAIERSNTAYADERKNIIPLVEKQDQVRAEQQRLADERKRQDEERRRKIDEEFRALK